VMAHTRSLVSQGTAGSQKTGWMLGGGRKAGGGERSPVAGRRAARRRVLVMQAGVQGGQGGVAMAVA
jgi:hypothetical protein